MLSLSHIHHKVHVGGGAGSVACLRLVLVGAAAVQLPWVRSRRCIPQFSLTHQPQRKCRPKRKPKLHIFSTPTLPHLPTPGTGESTGKSTGRRRGQCSWGICPWGGCVPVAPAGSGCWRLLGSGAPACVIAGAGEYLVPLCHCQGTWFYQSR